MLPALQTSDVIAVTGALTTSERVHTIVALIVHNVSGEMLGFTPCVQQSSSDRGSVATTLVRRADVKASSSCYYIRLVTSSAEQWAGLRMRSRAVLSVIGYGGKTDKRQCIGFANHVVGLRRSYQCTAQARQKMPRAKRDAAQTRFPSIDGHD
nr:hypothetical protein CFP56_03281 [Quercus suber]